METALVLLVALTLLIALALRHHGRLNPRGAHGREKEQRAESWLMRGGGRG